MKNAKKFTVLAIALATFLTSCDKDDNGNDIPQVQDTKNTIQTGTWKVTALEDSGVDKTAVFADYSFIFAENGALTATDGTTAQTGSWAVRNDRDSDDLVDDVELTISFPVSGTSILDDLNDDWDIVSVTETKIELIDRGDLNEVDDILTLERI